MISNLNGVYLPLDDARYLSEALDTLLAALPRTNQRPTARLDSAAGGLRKAVARASDRARDTSASASFQRSQHNSLDNEGYAVMSVAEAAKVLGITENGVRDLARRGKLRGRRVGRSWVLDSAAVVARSDR